jgi:hypothetical protein
MDKKKYENVYKSIMYTKELKQYSELSNVNLAWYVEEIIWFLMNYGTYVHKLITNSTELRTTRETNSCAATQELSCILWNPKINCHIHNSSPLVPILSLTNPVHTTLSYLSKIHPNIIHPSSSS